MLWGLALQASRWTRVSIRITEIKKNLKRFHLTNQRIPCACHDFATPHTSNHADARDFSHGATKSSDLRTIPCACHAKRCPATRRRTRSHHSPRLPRETHAARTIPHASHAKRTLSNVKMQDSAHLPRETHAQQRQNARFTAPAKRIHRPASSQTPMCIRSPTLATRHARPPSSSRTHHPPFPTHARRNAIPRWSAARTLPRFPTPATQNVHTHARDNTLETRSIPAPNSHTPRKRVKHDAAPRPPLRNKNPSLRIREKMSHRIDIGLLSSAF